MSAGISLKELVVMMVVAIVLLALVNKLPIMVGGLAMGDGTHALGSGFGASAAMGAVTVAGVTIAAGGTAVIASLPNAARGTQSLFDAFTNATAADNGKSSFIDNDLGMNAGGYLRSGEPNTLATAMGDHNSPVVRTHAASYDSIRSTSAGHDLKQPPVRDSSHSPITDSETQRGRSEAGSLASIESDSSIDSAESEIAAFVNSKPT